MKNSEVSIRKREGFGKLCIHHVAFCHFPDTSILLLLWECSRVLIPWTRHCVSSSYDCTTKPKFSPCLYFAWVLAKSAAACPHKIYINSQFCLNWYEICSTVQSCSYFIISDTSHQGIECFSHFCGDMNFTKALENAKSLWSLCSLGSPDATVFIQSPGCHWPVRFSKANQETMSILWVMVTVGGH